MTCSTGWSEVQLRQARAAWARRGQRRLHRQRREARRALAASRRAARVLRDDFGARSVIVFGSVLCPERFRQTSDVDLAVEGIRAGDFFSAQWRAAQIVGRPVDLVDLRDATPRLLRAIRSGGKALA